MPLGSRTRSRAKGILTQSRKEKPGQELGSFARSSSYYNFKVWGKLCDFAALRETGFDLAPGLKPESSLIYSTRKCYCHGALEDPNKYFLFEHLFC